MYNYRTFVNDVLGVLLSRGVVRLDAAGNILVFQAGRHILRLASELVAPENKERVDGRYYVPQHAMSPRDVLDVIDAMLDDFMFPELTGINHSLTEVRANLRTSAGREPFRDSPPGVVHYRLRENGNKYLLVSRCPANPDCPHEFPLFNRLSRRWDLGGLLKSFSLLREGRHGWRHEFEIDAVSVVGDQVCLFEMKHNTYPDAHEIVMCHMRAAQWINKWQEKMHGELRSFLPILYMRKRNGTPSPLLNHIYYEELPDTFSFDGLYSFKRYDVGNIDTRGLEQIPRSIDSS